MGQFFQVFEFFDWNTYIFDVSNAVPVLEALEKQELS